MAAILTATPGAQGFFNADFTTPAPAQTGGWRLVVKLPGAKASLAEQPVLVEEFVPARIEILASVKDALVLPGAAAAAVVEARYLFGLPAANLPLAMSYRHVPAEFRSAAFPEHRFTVVADPPGEPRPSRPPPSTPRAARRSSSRRRRRPGATTSRSRRR